MYSAITVVMNKNLKTSWTGYRGMTDRGSQTGHKTILYKQLRNKQECSRMKKLITTKMTEK